MAIPQLKKEYLDMIPDFHGENTLLPGFVEICEKLINKSKYLISSILAKVKGEAAINISTCVVRTCQDLKDALLNTYADKRDIYTLSIEMSELKQNNETPFEFFNKVHLLNLQISLVT
ncbi:uncharacterized protein [Diabrotica undecimpunctata]|uniref:uncharacterized protein n=1 Tax=Diabrotica undecimpunctata TaxID=50387 RepID=UPI003B63687C